MNSDSAKLVALTERNLRQIDRTLREAHPGAIGEEAGRFAQILDEAAVSARALAKSVISREDSVAVLRSLLTPYEDAHLFVADKSAPPASAWAGWLAEHVDGRFIVRRHAPSWPAPLPPLGAQLLSCDGVPALQYLQQRVAPFVDRRLFLPSTLSLLARSFSVETNQMPLMRAAGPARCAFDTGGGPPREWVNSWLSDDAGLAAALTNRSGPTSMQEIAPGVHWVSLPNFQPDDAELRRLHEVESRLAALSGARAVVFDTRGNGGGNSFHGRRIVRALIGGGGLLDLEARFPAHAEWRVSDLAIATIGRHIDALSRVTESDTALIAHLKALRTDLIAAKATGSDWVTPPAWEDPEEHAEFRPLHSRVVLVTDSRCASACLDFADLVTRLPGALHVGRSTAADTEYNDVAEVALEDGFSLWLPLKVWRGRARGRNADYRPAHVYPADLSDTSGLQQWVLGLLKK